MTTSEYSTSTGLSGTTHDPNFASAHASRLAWRVRAGVSHTVGVISILVLIFVQVIVIGYRAHGAQRSGWRSPDRQWQIPFQARSRETAATVPTTDDQRQRERQHQLVVPRHQVQMILPAHLAPHHRRSPAAPTGTRKHRRCGAWEGEQPPFRTSSIRRLFRDALGDGLGGRQRRFVVGMIAHFLHVFHVLMVLSLSTTKIARLWMRRSLISVP